MKGSVRGWVVGWSWPSGPDCHARITFKKWWLVLGETSSPTTTHPPTHPQTHSTDPFFHKTKVVVVTGIKKNSDFGRRQTPGKKTAGLQSQKSKNWSLTFQKSLIEKKLDENFSHENFPVRRSGTLFGKFDFGGLPFSNNVSP
jgi:hypothetical protein